MGGPHKGLVPRFTHVEEKQVAETKNKVQTVKNSPQHVEDETFVDVSMAAEMNDVSMDYRGDKCQNHAHAETKSSESRRARGDFAHDKENQGGQSKRTSRKPKEKDQERAKHRDENETNKAKIETKKGSEK